MLIQNVVNINKVTSFVSILLFCTLTFLTVQRNRVKLLHLHIIENFPLTAL